MSISCSKLYFPAVWSFKWHCNIIKIVQSIDEMSDVQNDVRVGVIGMVGRLEWFHSLPEKRFWAWLGIYP